MTPLMDFVNHHPASNTVAVNAEFRGAQAWRADFPQGLGLAYLSDRDYSQVSWQNLIQTVCDFPSLTEPRSRSGRPSASEAASAAPGPVPLAVGSPPPPVTIIPLLERSSSSFSESVLQQ